MDQFTPLTNDRGLYKKILIDGSGVCPVDGSKVNVKYQGVLEDGTVFDESDEDGFEFELGSNESLHGWEIGIKSMRKGEKAIFVLRADYAYGEAGYLVIPPNTPLIFCIDLVEFINK